MKNKKSRLYRALAVCAAASLALSAVPATAQAGQAFVSETQAEDATLRIATSGFVDSFNPFTSVYLLPTNTIRYMYDNLVQFSAKDGNPEPSLAEEWETNEDGTVWTFKLREGLKWSDGEPLTANDAVYTYTQLMEVPELGVANGSYVANFEKVEAPDDRTLVITLKQAQAANPATEVPIVPEHIWSKIESPAEFANDSNVVGSGPYLLESYSANEQITLKSNPNFWRGEPKIDGIQYIYYTDSDAQVQALRSGDVDFATNLSPAQFKALEGTEGIEFNSGQGRRYYALYMNPGQKTRDDVEYGTVSAPLKDINVRQAIRLGTDVDTLLDKVLEGHGVKATSFVPASFPDWTLSADNPVVVDYDPEAAKAKLAEAGWVDSGDGIRAKDGQRLSVKLYVSATDSIQQSVAEFFVPWMKEIGVEVQVESTDGDTISTNTDAGNYDMYLSGWSLNPDPDYQLGINTCWQRPTETDGTGGISQDGYCNPEFDRLYAEQNAELDHEKRMEIVQEMLAMHYEAATQATLWYANSLEAYNSDRFTGFSTMPEDGGIIANQAGYWGFLTVEPAGSSDAASGENGAGSNNTGLLIGGGVVIAAVLAALGFANSRRKKSADVE